MQFEYIPRGRALSDQAYLADIRRVAKLLGQRTLSMTQYGKHGKYGPGVSCRRGGWNAMIRRAGLLPSRRRKATAENVLNDIRRVARLLNTQSPTQDQYSSHGNCGLRCVRYHYGSWRKAVAAAGLTPSTRLDVRSRVELMDNLEKVWIKLGRAPIISELSPPLSNCSVSPYQRCYGGWQKALQAFVKSRRHKSQSPKIDLVEPVVLHKTSRTVTSSLRYEILRRDRFRCRLCGRSPANDPAIELQVDHIKPWSRGGETVRENLQALCQTCNSGKRDRV